MTEVAEIKSLASLERLVSEEGMAEIRQWQAKYPQERKRPPIMAALRVVQRENNQWLKEEHMDLVAAYLDVPRIAVYEVATFYTMFHLKPVGEHVISVCTNLSCMLRGSEKMVNHLKKRLNISLGETTADGKITLKEVECMAACGGAPMLEVKEIFHENLTPEKIDSILADLGIEVSND